MAFALEYFDAAGNAVADGVFIPVANLPGVQAAELAAGEPANTKESKVALALLNAISANLPASVIGLTLAKGSPTGAGADVLNLPYTCSWQRLINLSSDGVDVVPVPTTGANTGVGGVNLTTIFAGAVKVAAGGAVAGAGVVIPSANLDAYSPISHADINPAADSREWLMGQLDALASNITRRAAGVASAVVTATTGSLGSAAIPAAYYAATDPTSGIASADLPKLGLITRSNAWSIQVTLNQSTQAFEVRSVAS